MPSESSAAPCQECGGVLFHKDGCSAADENRTSSAAQEPMTVEALVAQARVVQSELAWLGGFLETGVPDRPDLPKRTDRAYRLIELLVEEVTP